MHLSVPLLPPTESKFPVVPGWEAVALVTASHRRLNAWSEPHTQLKCHLTLDHEIEALCTLTLGGRNLIAVFSGGQIELYGYKRKPAAFHCVLRIPMGDSSGIAKCVDSGPKLAAREFGAATKRSLLALHAYTGFVTIVDVSGLLDDRADKPRKWSPKTRRSNTFGIGNVIVCQMEFMHTATPTVALVVRDIDFRFEIRWLGIAPELENARLLHSAQYNEFPFLAAAQKGTMVVAGPRLTVYPAQLNSLEPGENCANITTLAFENPQTFGLESLQYSNYQPACSASIDDSRTLLITTQGDTFLVFLAMRFTGPESGRTAISQFETIDLGKSTIASSVVHLRENQFYAASRTSRTVLFRVLSKKPFLDVGQVFTNSPPILDVLPETHPSHASMLLFRGGLHDGEICRYAPFYSSISLESTVSVSSTTEQIRITGKGHLELLTEKKQKILSAKDLTEIKTDDLVTNELANERLSHEPELKRRCFSRSSAEARDRLSLGALSVGNLTIGSLEITNPAKITYNEIESLSLPGFDEITDIMWHGENDEYLDLVSWNGRFARVQYSDSKITTLFNMETPLTGKIDMALFEDEDRQTVVLLDGTGSVFQIRTWGNDLVHTRTTNLQPAAGTFRMSEGVSECLFLYDHKAVYHLESRATPRIIHIHTFDEKLVSVDGTANELFALFKDGTLCRSKWNITPLQRDLFVSPEAYFSDGMFLRAVSYNRKYFVALQLKFEPSSNQALRNVTSLVLFRRSDFKACHVYKANGSFADICIMDSEYGNHSTPSIVALHTSHSPDSPLLQSFSVEKGKIVPQSPQHFTGQIPAHFSFVKMACHKNTVWVTGDSTCRFTLAAQTWHAETTDSGSQFYGVDVCASDHMVVVADSVRGLFVGKPETQSLERLRLAYEPSFLTAVALLKSSPSIIYGDSAGNLGLVSVNADFCSCEQVFAFNVGAPINVVKVVSEQPLSIVWGTADGALYRSGEIKSEKLAEADTAALGSWFRVDGEACLPAMGAVSGSCDESPGSSELSPDDEALELFEARFSRFDIT